MNFVFILPTGPDPFTVAQFQLIYATCDGVCRHDPGYIYHVATLNADKPAWIKLFLQSCKVRTKQVGYRMTMEKGKVLWN